jgi:uncharacterized protein
VLLRPKFKLTDAHIQYWRELIDEAVQVVTVTTEVDFPRDRKEAKFLACALAHQIAKVRGTLPTSLLR